MDRVLRNSQKSSILACGNTHESVSMKALFEFDNLFSLTSYFTNGIEWFSCLIPINTLLYEILIYFSLYFYKN